jgi:hypothetical protein
VTSPTANEIHVIYPAGIVLSGTACGLTNEYGWVFNLDNGDGYYHEDYIGGISKPRIVGNGPWQVEDRPIGSANDPGLPYTIVVVLADQDCNSKLLAIKIKDKDYRTRKLPATCKIAGQRTVYVSGP